ncbi:DUF732 domain-containing protein [Mycolicibacterium pulveris]|uniref:DUF732 domain-containing protein n=1 Tax=Mycolicibacterium pulveris TaxID=36813 RepID=A0A7I7UF57_MYCPV|nr:DUF732 domain-containing protein [Mycolicibacterium pulveris]MCV6978710.1 DUF732 domain-containing protein [Mycolicibacterium pulveris]BBY80094.1 hypothetical protein MPUL_12520 [Mycolicibacterium pulveris]
MGFNAFRRCLFAALAALLVGVGGAVAVAPAQAGQDDDQFIELLELEGVPYANETEVIRAGKQYCLDRTRPNANMGRVNNDVMTKMGWSGSEMQDFARAAIRAYC